MSSFATQCPRCRAENEGTERQCRVCGASLAEQATGTGARAPERRQLTVVFCDIVGFTEHSLRLDPEELQDLLDRYRSCCQDALRRWGGIIARFLGDGLLIYFGYPAAHGDDAKRAVSAAFDIVEAIKAGKVPVRAGDFPALRIRIGIHTGVVMVGDVGPSETREYLAVVGAVPTLATRLQQEAAANQILISGDTAELVEAEFELRELSPRRLKGFHEPTTIYEVLDVRRNEPEFPGAGSSLFVDREEEQREIRKALAELAAGSGAAIAISGEAGLGKSRLVKFIEESSPTADLRWLVFRCKPQSSASELHPVSEWLRKHVGQSHEAVSKAGELRELAELLSFEAPRKESFEHSTPSQIRRRTFDLLLAWLAPKGGAKPQVLVFEDLQWADHSTLELLESLARRTGESPLLLIMTHRDDFTLPEWQGARLRRIALQPLTTSDSLQIVRNVLADLTQELGLTGMILKKAQGNPLFLEEFTKSIVKIAPEGLAIDPAAIVVPVSLRDSLMARLDRLGTAKRLLQIASVLGESFSFEALVALAGLTRGGAEQELATLLREGLICRLDEQDGDLLFKHALIRDLAYDTLLRRDRQVLHRRLAEQLAGEEQRGGAGQPPEVTAFHFALGGDPARAAAFFLEAGRGATRRSANREALDHFRRAIEELQRIPKDSRGERQEGELGVRLAMPPALVATSGWSSPELEHNFLEAKVLSEALDDPETGFDALRGLFNVYLLRADMKEAGKVAEALRALAGEVEEERLTWEALRVEGVYRFYRGDFARATEQLTAALDIYDPERHRAYAYVYGVEPGVVTLCYLAWIAWFTKRPEAAAEISARALALAEKAEHPFSQGYALSFDASLRQCLGEAAAVERQAEKAILLAEERGFPYWQAWGKILLGWAKAAQGDCAEGEATLREGMRLYEATGSALILGYATTLLGLALRDGGDLRAAKSTLTRAVGEMEATGVKFFLEEARGALADLAGPS